MSLTPALAERMTKLRLMLFDVDGILTDGALYFVLRVHTDQSDVALAERLVREHGVAVIPGSTFGLEDGCYLRVSYGALDGDTVAEGIGRLVRGVRALVPR